MPNLSNQLLELMQESARDLIKNYHHQGKNTQTQLIIPEYRGTNNLRISEQELRFVMTGLIPRVCPGINFSVETPTDKLYGTGRSASTDLTLYTNNLNTEFKNNLNIELKAHHPELRVINKDIEKLCQENVEGAWCHIFKNEDRATVKALFDKFAESIIEHFDSQTQPISFHILILGSKTLLSREGHPNDWKRLSKEKISNRNEWLMQNIFNIEYDAWDQASSGDVINKWQIQKY